MTLAPTADELLACCASTAWARAVADRGPYPDLPALEAVASDVWWSLPAADWLEALAAHPRIGDRPPVGSQERAEQAAAATAPTDVLERIAVGNRAYEERFGMTYIVRAAGRTAEQLLVLLDARLRNHPDTELGVAAAQQWEITQLRLRKRYGTMGA